MSFAQERLWFLDKLVPFNHIYNIPVALRIKGPLNINALKKSINEIVRRHENLRSNFLEINGKPALIITSNVKLSGSIIDLHQLPDDEKAMEIKRLATNEANRFFNLSEDSLLRYTLLRLGPRDYIILLTLHHIISDAWSGEIITQELFALYTEFSRGNPSPLPEIQVQYADFASWQHDCYLARRLDSQFDFWKKHLDGTEGKLELPTDYPRPSLQTFNGQTESFVIDLDLRNRLHTLGMECGATLFMVMYGAFATLLYRYSSQDKIIVGTPIANRNHPEIEGLIGFFANTLALCTDFEDIPNFRHLIIQIKEMMLDAYDNQDLPFERIVDELYHHRDLSRNPLVQVMFTFQNIPTRLNLSSMDSMDLEFEAVDFDRSTVRFDLEVNLWDGPEGILVNFIYNRDLFKSDTITRMANHYKNLLRSIVEDPHKNVTDLELISQVEKHQQSVEWNDTHAKYDKEKCIHQVFEKQVTLTPNAIAVEFENARITYKELNDKANKLAHYLQSFGVKPDTLVGLCLMRSIDMIVAVLGVLKSGGAYLPIDPEYPEERKQFMLTDAKIEHLITSKTLLENLPSIVKHSIDLQNHRVLSHQAATNPESFSTSRNIAYCIYTSGSTGQPKGVLIEHQNVIRLLLNSESKFEFTGNDIWTMAHSYCFDFSVWEMYGALFFGGKLIIVSDKTVREFSQFADLIKTKDVTILNQTPSSFNQLSREILEQKLTNLSIRYIIFGGEALYPAQLEEWKNTFPDIKLINMYGITETTVHVTFKEITAREIADNLNNIGVPIPTAKTYILDDKLRFLPIGAVGEICVGGKGVGRGYLNRDELTKEKFVQNPFVEGDRLYRSGDLGKLLPNGEMIHLGRMDDQVQIRGFRVELGEIKNCLIKHSLINNAEVIVRANKNSKMLTAYIESGSDIDVEELRDYLRNVIPQYMIPVAYVFLDEFPLTSNGKVNIKAFPAPNFTKQIELNYIAPKTELQKTLVKIWSKVLKIEKIGIEDNFFSIGGDSLLSIRIVALSKLRSINFSVMDLFQYSTIRTLSEAIKKGDSEIIEEIDTKSFGLISNKEKEQLEKEEIVDAYPLSSMQMGMIFHSELENESGIYHDIFSYHLLGSPDIHIFEKALTAIIEQQPILRTGFEWVSERYIQKVYPNVNLPLSVIDISGLSLVERNQYITNWLAEEKTSPIDFRRAPLFHIYIFIRNNDSFQYCISFHHSILDGWSVAQFNTSFFVNYIKLSNGKEILADASKIQYNFKDYIALEQKSVDNKSTYNYWQRKLKDVQVTRIDKSADSKTFTKNRGIGAYDNNMELVRYSERLIRLSQKLGIPLKTILLGVHVKVLSILSGNYDVVTGLVTNGRPETMYSDESLGLYLNTIPFRIQLKDQSWEDLIKEIYQQETQMLAHRRFPIQIMQKEFDFELDEVLFNYINFHVYGSIIKDNHFDVLDAEVYEQTNFALVFNFGKSVKNDEIYLNIVYDKNKYDEADVSYIYQYYIRVLDSLLTNISESHIKPNLLTKKELNKIVHDWNDTTVHDYPDNRCLHQLFETRAETDPDAIALIFEDHHITYKELNKRSNQLARYLISLGVGPDVLVGICIERSIEMIIGLMGILKAGGAYVPFDSDYPKERLDYMLSDSNVPILISQDRIIKEFKESYFEGDQPVLVSLNSNWNKISKEDIHNPVVEAEPQNLAYMIYTSGSTGKPKGVMNSHYGICNRLLWMQDMYQLTSNDRILQKTPFSFDVSVWEFFWPLITGAGLVIAKPGGHRDSYYLARLICEKEVTVLHFVPPMLAVFLETGYISKCKSVRDVICSGEALPGTVKQRFYDYFKANLHNLYGPTEAAVDVTYHQCLRDSGSDTVPIGRPVANTQIYILDRHLNVVPTGVPGELHIAGINLARGYLNRQDLTSEKFIPNFIEKGRETRLYKTGDLVRYQEDGNIEFLGRMDHQVKIRGFRIELGEIESTLLKHPVVKEAVVILKEITSQEKYFIGYIVLKDGEEVETEEIRRSLKKSLFDYMIPQYLIKLREMPLLPNGKLDRKRLPQPDRRSAGMDYTAPRTITEKILVPIWSDVLKKARISIHDNFFEIGGHSLNATQIISRLREALSLEVPLRSIFENQTIEALGETIDAITIGGKSSMAPIKSVPVKEAVPLSFSQERLWLLNQLEGDTSTYNMPIILRISGSLSTETVEICFNEILKRHEALRTVFHTKAGHPVQVILKNATIPITYINLSRIPENMKEKEVRRLVVEEVQKPFNLSTDILIRCLLLCPEEKEYVLAVTMHHIVSDGWSLEIFVKEMAALYQAFTEGKASPLSPLSIQYGDFALWQRRFVTGNVRREQLDYWWRNLEGTPEILQLPMDKKRPNTTSYKGDREGFAIDALVKYKLELICQEEKASLFMALLSVFAVLLYRYSAQDDMVIGTNIAGRNRKEFEPLIGPFVNNLPLRILLNKDPSFRELVKRVKTTALGAYANQDIPFEDVINELGISRNLSYAPIFQVLFVVQNIPMEHMRLSDLKLEPFGMKSDISMFDITLNIYENEKELFGVFEYKTELFENDTILRMIEKLNMILENAVSFPDRTLSAISQTNPEENQQMLDSFNVDF